VPGVDWAIYNGPFPWIPQTYGLKADSKGHAETPGLSDLPATGIPAGTKNLPGTVSVFTGYISVPADGEYSFYLACDTKAFLRIHDIQVIDADYGYPGGLPRTGNIVLKKGLHPFRLSYHRDQDQGEPFLKLDWSGPGIRRQQMGKGTFFRLSN
ncbi:MAG: PA14 domain-containing protein, partial [Chitinophaga rupis]